MKTAQRCSDLALLPVAILYPAPLWACQLGRLAVLHVTLDGARPLLIDPHASKYGVTP